MRVPVPLTTAFGPDFQEILAAFALEEGLLSDPADLISRRFLARSVAPHVKKLSSLFNRAAELYPDGLPSAQAQPGDSKQLRAQRRRPVKLADDADLSLDPYWKNTSNREHLRLAYFLSFMPPNLYRTAAIWSELSRLGFRWSAGDKLRALELGAGPAAGACGIAAGERFAPVGLPSIGNWALLEQDRATLELGARWAERYFGHAGQSDWGLRPYHRKLSLSAPGGLLPRTAPKFNLMIMSYFLNEFADPPRAIAEQLLDLWERHLDREGIVIIVEPALRALSRRLLELRRQLLDLSRERKASWLQILLPCLGHQSCGALAEPEDWCHEEVGWWRPPYLRKIDELTGLDRKSLPFSYLVLSRSSRPREEILPALARTGTRHRLVSPAHYEGKEQEFFLCGEDGKRRARYRAQGPEDPAAELERGDILVDAAFRGDVQATRIEKIRGVK